MAIIPIFGVKLDKEDNVFELLSKEEFISEMEKTRKTEDGKYLLISTEAKISRSQAEVDSILDEFLRMHHQNVRSLIQQDTRYL